MRALLSVSLTIAVQAATEDELEHIRESEAQALQRMGWTVDEIELINIPEA